jgi:hypothetical protein
MLDQFLICWEVDEASLALTVLHVLVRHFGKAGWQWNEVKSESQASHISPLCQPAGRRFQLAGRYGNPNVAKLARSAFSR